MKPKRVLMFSRVVSIALLDPTRTVLVPTRNRVGVAAKHADEAQMDDSNQIIVVFRLTLRFISHLETRRFRPLGGQVKVILKLYRFVPPKHCFQAEHRRWQSGKPYRLRVAIQDNTEIPRFAER